MCRLRRKFDRGHSYRRNRAQCRNVSWFTLNCAKEESCGEFNSVVTTLSLSKKNCVAWNDWVLVNTELVGTWKETYVVQHSLETCSEIRISKHFSRLVR